jgi:RNA polymerase sigma-70 factor (ECF subfamily)
MATPEPVADERPARSQHDVDEAELVRRAQLGSVAAFEQLVLARGPHLHRFLVVRLRDEADALDALQETLAAAWQRLPSLRSRDRFWPWLCGIAAHKAADVARTRPWTGGEAESIAGEGYGAFELRDAIAALPERYREVLLLRYVVGLSEEEAAEALGIRVGTVKSRSARARKALKEALT